MSGLHRADRDRIVERYNRRLDAHPEDDRAALATGAGGRHELALDAVIAVGLASGTSVLDVGCGFGALWSRLQARGIDCDYTGYDINPRIVAEAAARHTSLHFETVDILVQSYPVFDFVVSSSSFNLVLEHEDNYQFLERLLRSMHAHARQGVAVDLMTSRVDHRSPDVFYYEPERVLSIAAGITNRFALRHDFPLFQFCVYLYPRFAGWAR